MATFVLVHGGGQGAWCWQRVSHLLRVDGHEVHAVTLTGFGERSHLDTSLATFETFVEDVANVLRFEDLHDVVLVGHSLGGAVIPRVAEAVSDRIADVVWLAAVVCADGETVVAAVPPSGWVAEALSSGADGTVKIDPHVIADVNTHDGTAEQREFVRRRHTVSPPQLRTEPGRLSAFLSLRLRTGYVIAADDRTIEPQLQRRFAERLPGVRCVEVEGGHNCMITRPRQVATALASFRS